MVEEQERQEEELTWYHVTKKCMEKINIEVSAARELSKSALKTLVDPWERQ